MRQYYVKPHIPETLKPFNELCYNIWSTWDQNAVRLMSRIDPVLFRQVNHDPVHFLHLLGADRIKKLATDPGFIHELGQVVYEFASYLGFEGTFSDDKGRQRYFQPDDLVAYLSMEFSLHESIPIYSGGLGILAGDYLKAASDVGLPLVGVGLLYRLGYFTQRINPKGIQEEIYRENVWWLKPVEEVLDKEGHPMTITLDLMGRPVVVKIWQVHVGRVKLYLLDTNVSQNPPDFRAITDNLYDADREERIRQELILGRGGLRALRRLDLLPKVYHLNEGHSAFIIIERLKELVLEKGYSLEDACNFIRHTSVFTTHTPVVEGNENFDQQLVLRYVRDDLRSLGMNEEDFAALGRIKPGDKTFWLPALAIRFSRFINGVSGLHAQVSRQMWQSLFPNHNNQEIPIQPLNNGVHLPTWQNHEISRLFDRYIGPDYVHQAESPAVWEKINDIPDDELWQTHLRIKRSMIEFIRRRLVKQLHRLGYANRRYLKPESILNARELTIGIARRFAAYKRSDLIFSEPDRLHALLTHPDRPIQILLAGKSHPADDHGKQIIKRILEFIEKYDVRERVVFIEDYDMNVARHMVQGVDVWLNTPVKPMEASGTSGMKAGLNGVLHLSVLDGWWPECYDGTNGWAINAGENYHDPAEMAAADANQIYDLLENEIAPIFYDRSSGDLPKEWVAMMKRAISTVGMGFNMHRMIRNYIDEFYLPVFQTRQTIMEEDKKALKGLSAIKADLDTWWYRLWVEKFTTSLDNGSVSSVGDRASAEAIIRTNGAPLDMLKVEIFHKYHLGDGNFEVIDLAPVETLEDSRVVFKGQWPLKTAGPQEVGLRIRPGNALFRETYRDYILWAD